MYSSNTEQLLANSVVNMGLDPAKYERYKELKAKFDIDTISEEESEELNALLSESEQNKKLREERVVNKAKRRQKDEMKRRLEETNVDQTDLDNRTSSDDEKNDEEKNEYVFGEDDTDILLNSIHSLHCNLKEKARLKNLTELDTNDPKAFKDWSQKFESDMDDFELHHFVLGRFTNADVYKPLFKQYDSVARKLLCRNISLKFREMISGDPTAFIAYQRIKTYFEGTKEIKTVKAIGDFYQAIINFQSLENLVTVLKRVIEVFDQVFAEGKMDRDSLWKAFFLAALPNHYSHLRTTLSVMSKGSLDRYFNLALQEHRHKAEQSASNKRMHANNLNGGNASKRARYESNQQSQQYSGSSSSLSSQTRNANGANKSAGCWNCGGPHRASQCRSKVGSSNGYQRTDQNRGGQSGTQRSGFQPNGANSTNQNPNQNDYKQNRSYSNNNVNSNPNNLNRKKAEQSSQPNGARSGNNLMYAGNPMLNRRSIFDDFDEFEEPPKVFFGNNLMFKKKIDDMQRRAIVCNARDEELVGLDPDAWYSDSGCSDPSTNNEKNLRFLTRMQGEKLYTADGHGMDVQGLGEVRLKSTLGAELVMTDVIVCKDLKASFLSHSSLDKKYGIEVSTGKKMGELRLIRRADGVLLFIGVLENNGLYKLSLAKELPIMTIAAIRLKSNEEKVLYWHGLLGHVNFPDLSRIESRLDVVVTDKIDCYVCTRAKFKKLPHPTGGIKTTGPLQMIHVDLSGEIRIPNRLRVKYFLLIIDDYSRFHHITLLKKKSDAYGAIYEFKQLMENQLEKKLKIIRSDNGGEFNNAPMSEMCAESGVQQQLTTPYCPKQNSVAERAMGTVKQLARTLLIDRNLGANFWPFAAMYSVKIKNHLPCSAIDFDIPYERFYNQPANYSKLKRFGERVLYREERNNDFQPPGEDGIFLGMPPGVKGYWVYSLKRKTVVTTREVKFLLNSPYEKEHIADDAVECDQDLNRSELYTEDETSASYNIRCESAAIDAINARLPYCTPFDDAKSVDSGRNREQAGVSENLPVEPQAQQQSEREAVQSNNLQLPELDDENSMRSAIMDELRAAYRFNAAGDIVLNQTQKKDFERKYPDINLGWRCGANIGLPGKNNYYTINSITAPKTYQQAMNSSDASSWKAAMDDEIRTFNEMRTGDLVPRPKNAQVLPVIWVLSIKTKMDGSVGRYKGRLVVLGNKQRLGRDFAEGYAPVVSEITFRTVLSYAVTFGLLVHQIDFKCAFLNAPVDGEIYIEQPAGYRVPGKENYVYKLNRALYGLIQSARQWNKTLNERLIKLGFRRSCVDECLYIGQFDGELFLLAIYVDDALLACRELKIIERIKKELMKEFEVTDLGPVRHFLNLDIEHDVKEKTMHISQRHYIRQLLEFTGMSECHPVSTPVTPGADLYSTEGALYPNIEWYQSVMGKLIYLATHSRPDIAFVVSRLCSFMHAPREQHVAIVKRVLRYLKGTVNYRMKFEVHPLDVNVYCDADFANDKVTSRSITGVLAFVFGNLVDWYSRSQKRVSNSTCHAEVQAIVDGAMESEYLFQLMAEMKVNEVQQITLYNDNQSALATIRESGQLQKNKHYRVDINLVREMVQQGWLRLVYCPTDEMLADFLTKPLVECKLTKLTRASGITPE